MTTFITSDLHFNHENIIKFCDRPFTSLGYMNEAMVYLWNRDVGRKDTVIVVGDFAYVNSKTGSMPVEGLFSLLNGRKILIVGNHDEHNPAVLKLPWAEQHYLMTLRENGARAEVCHYPLETWKNAQKGYLMLHGHSHGTLKTTLPHRYDVGVDVVGWQRIVVPFGEYVERAANEEFIPSDHHGD